jgi:hypothetical protein
MIGHEAALDLAALAVDFVLSADERAVLDEHLARCLPCRRRALAFRADARDIAAAPVRPMPGVRADELLGSVLARSGPVSHAMRLALLAAMIALLALGAAAVGAGLLRSHDSDLSIVPPVPAPEAETVPVDLSAGGEALTLTGDLRVRSQPRVADDSIKYEPLLTKGTRLRVLDGPVYASGYWWYRVSPYVLEDGRSVPVALSDGATDGWVASAARDGTRWIDAFDPRLLLSWHRVGEIPTVVDDVVGFAGGYVAIESAAPHLWFSPDGIAWQEIALPSGPAATSTALSAEAWALATDGQRMLVVGDVHQGCSETPSDGRDPTGDRVCTTPASWLSTDGVTWRRSGPWGEVADVARLVAVWPVPSGGWDAVAASSSGERMRWRGLLYSADGLTWTWLADGSPIDPAGGLVRIGGVADTDGRRLLWVVGAAPDSSASGGLAGNGAAEGTTTTVTTWGIGGGWATVAGLDGWDADATCGIVTVDAAWWLAGSRKSPIDPLGLTISTIWRRSAAADGWQAMALPDDGNDGVPVTDLLRADLGYVAVGSSDEPGAVTHETWLSSDGTQWIELPRSADSGEDYGPALIADGPAGLVGIGPSSTAPTGESVAWALR